MAKHIHIYFTPRKTRDQAPGSVPPSNLMPLVDALHAAIAARQGTQDAGFDESKVKRDEGGKFSAQQHSAKASEHEAAANASPKGTPAHEAHAEAAQAHTLAAQHITAQTGWASHHSAKAMQASHKAAQTAGPASLEQLKATASNPQASVEARAAAVGQLDKMEKAANAVAASPHAVPAEIARNEDTEAGLVWKGNKWIKKPNLPVAPAGSGSLASALGTPKSGPDGKPMGLHPSLAAVTRPGTAVSGSPDSPKGEINQLTGKPTSATAKGTKAATHELLSTGHPFSIDELMKATGAKTTSTLMTALSDLKSPKYAGALGHLAIVKRPDGMYHVQKGDDSATKPYNREEYAKTQRAEAAERGAANMQKNGVSGIPTGSGPQSKHGVTFGKVGGPGIMDSSGPAGNAAQTKAADDLKSRGFQPDHANSYGSATEAVHAYKHPESGEKVHISKNHSTGEVNVKPAPGGSTPSSFFKQAVSKLGQNKRTASSTSSSALKTRSKNPGGFNVPSPDPKAPKPVAHASGTGQSFLPKVPMSQAGAKHTDAAEYAHMLTRQAEKSGLEVDHKHASEAHEKAAGLYDKADDVVKASTHNKLAGAHERKARELRPTPEPFGSVSSQQRTESAARFDASKVSPEMKAKLAGLAPQVSSQQNAAVNGLHDVLKKATTSWHGNEMPPDSVRKAAEYMHNKKAVDPLKVADATGLSVGAAMHLRKAHLEHVRANSGSTPKPMTQQERSAQRSNAFLSQKWIKK